MDLPLDKLPVPAGLVLPPWMLGLLPLVSVLLLAYVAIRMVRVRPRPRGVSAFLVLALSGGVLQVTDFWWQYSLPVLILTTLAALFAVIEVAVRPAGSQQRSMVVAVGAVNAGAYLYLVAVLAAHS
jgi:hypothetical protein